MNSHSQKEKKKIKEVKGLKKVFKRLFSGSKMDGELIESISSKEVDLNEIKNLIKKGANVNARDCVGNSCLMLACDFNDFELVQLLLSEKADIGISNEFKQTALHIAASKRSLNILRLLINSDDSNINKQNIDGNTPLHIAVLSGNKDTVDFLLKREANKHIKNKMGFKPIEIAKMKDFQEIRILLLKN